MLEEDLGSFDLVHAANLLCRLPNPQAFLDRLNELVAPGGQLLLTTPFTWLEDFTPKRIGYQDKIVHRHSRKSYLAVFNLS